MVDKEKNSWQAERELNETVWNNGSVSFTEGYESWVLSNKKDTNKILGTEFKVLKVWWGWDVHELT